MNYDSYLNLIFPNGLSLDDGLVLLFNVGVYIIGICLYGVFIFHFYRFLAARDMFTFDLSRYEGSRFRGVRGLIHAVGYLLKYIVVFPFFAFFWLAVLTLILAILSKDRSFADVLLIALATVCAIRVTAYYHEDLSRDLSKILPFAVLGVFIIDASFFAADDSLAIIRDASNHRETIFYAFVLLVALEFVLRIVMGYLMLLITGRRRILARRESPGAAEPPPEEADESQAYEEGPQESAGAGEPSPAAASAPAG
ncbi:MAG: hypothetical protein OXI91_08135 [Chloroflexota bacterium]|nr:hypothetical protein [Chloroflexota bacterium]